MTFPTKAMDALVENLSSPVSVQLTTFSSSFVSFKSFHRFMSGEFIDAAAESENAHHTGWIDKKAQPKRGDDGPYGVKS